MPVARLALLLITMLCIAGPASANHGSWALTHDEGTNNFLQDTQYSVRFAITYTGNDGSTTAITSTDEPLQLVLKTASGSPVQTLVEKTNFYQKFNSSTTYSFDATFTVSSNEAPAGEYQFAASFGTRKDYGGFSAGDGKQHEDVAKVAFLSTPESQENDEGEEESPSNGIPGISPALLLTGLALAILVRRK